MDTALGNLSMGSEAQQMGGIDRRCNADSSSEGAGDCCQDNRIGEGGGERAMHDGSGESDEGRGEGDACGRAVAVRRPRTITFTRAG